MANKKMKTLTLEGVTFDVGGSSVQPDLAQNDSTAPDYVKNRTHWTDDDGTVHKLDEKFLPDEALGINVIAEVGQLIVVKDIDKNGKPIDWEAVNFPAEPKQNDFSQNDSNAVDYIKNRTHYSVLGETEVDSLETGSTFSQVLYLSNYNDYQYQYSCKDKSAGQVFMAAVKQYLDEGAKISFIIRGGNDVWATTSDLGFRTIDDAANNAIIWGNPYVASGSGEDTGLKYSVRYWTSNGNLQIARVGKNDGTGAVNPITTVTCVIEAEQVAKRLDARYLPNVSDLDADWLAELKTALGI